MGKLHGSRVFVSPNKICYLKFRGYQGGGVWWVPLFGPLNPSNLSFGCGFFDKVRQVTPALSREQGELILDFAGTLGQIRNVSEGADRRREDGAQGSVHGPRQVRVWLHQPLRAQGGPGPRWLQSTRMAGES